MGVDTTEESIVSDFSGGRQERRGLPYRGGSSHEEPGRPTTPMKPRDPSCFHLLTAVVVRVRADLTGLDD